MSTGTFHSLDPGRHNATNANNSSIATIRNGLNENGTRTFARTASNGINEPFGSRICRRTVRPATAFTYNERGDDNDTELTPHARRSASGRTRTVHNTFSDAERERNARDKTPSETGSTRT